MDLSTFVCPDCGKTFPLMRNHGEQRKRGHKKDIWCPYCKDTKQFIEVRKRDCFVKDDGDVIYR